MNIDQVLSKIPNNFTTEQGSNNRKYFEAYVNFKNASSADIRAETIGLLRRELTGDVHIGLDRLGSFYGVRRGGLSNNEYKKVIILYKDRSDFYKINSWENLVQRFVDFDWASSGSISAGIDSGRLLDASGFLSGTRRLLGGRTEQGRFLPNIDALGEITITLQNVSSSNQSIITKFIMSREPFGARVRVEYV